MELALAELSVFLPPVLLVTLFFIYRNLIFSFNGSPYGKVITVMLNELIVRGNQFIQLLSQSSHALKVILQVPLMLYRSIANFLRTFLLSMKFGILNVSSNIQSVFEYTLKTPSKSIWDQFSLGTLIIGGCLVLVVTYWFLQYYQSVPQIPVAEKKRSVRRKRKMT